MLTPTSSPHNSPWVQLRQQMAQHFNEGEIKTLCFDLGLDEGELEPGNKIQKITSLIGLIERQGRLAELLSAVTETRPHLSWPTLAALQTHPSQHPYTTGNPPIKRGKRTPFTLAHFDHFFQVLLTLADR